MLTSVVRYAQQVAMRRHRRDVENFPSEPISDIESLTPLLRFKRDPDVSNEAHELERTKRYRRTVAGDKIGNDVAVENDESGGAKRQKLVDDKGNSKVINEKKENGDHKRQIKDNKKDKHTKKKALSRKTKKHAMSKKEVGTNDSGVRANKKTKKDHQKTVERKRNIPHHQAKHHKSKKYIIPPVTGVDKQHHISKRFAGIVKRAVNHLTRADRDPIGHLNHPRDLAKELNKHRNDDKKTPHRATEDGEDHPATPTSSGHSRMKRYRRALNHEITKRVLHAHKRKSPAGHKQKQH